MQMPVTGILRATPSEKRQLQADMQMSMLKVQGHGKKHTMQLNTQTALCWC